MSAADWYCGAFQPDPPQGMEPYRCTEPYDHPGDHRATVKDRSWALLVVVWPRVPTEKES